MNQKSKQLYLTALIFVLLFVLFAILINQIDVASIGFEGANVGFSSINGPIRDFIGTNDLAYSISEVLGYVNIAVCFFFGIIGFYQLTSRKDLFKVDWDILALGAYYIFVIAFYLAFTKITINYRPIEAEASFPSSHTVLTICVVFTAIMQIKNRIQNKMFRIVLIVLSILLLISSIISRFISGVHWFTDYLGAIIISIGFILFYKGTLIILDEIKKQKKNK